MAVRQGWHDKAPSFVRSKPPKQLRQVGELFSGRRVAVEETLIRAYRVAREATGVSASVDRVSTPNLAMALTPADSTLYVDDVTIRAPDGRSSNDGQGGRSDNLG